MPIHDWSRVEAGIFHDFHHAWIEEIKRALNKGVLPNGYYAMAEQYASRYGPDVLTLQGSDEFGAEDEASESNGGSVLLAPPKLAVTGEAEFAFYTRKQKVVAIHHVSGDQIVAMVEIVSPGNKSSQVAIRTFAEKAADLLRNQIQLLVLDLQPLTKRDPEGIHGVIWDNVVGEEYTAPKDKPLTLAAYETDAAIRCYVVRAAVGDVLADMPLFLRWGAHVVVPLESTYQAAWEAVPKRWRTVLERST